MENRPTIALIVRHTAAPIHTNCFAAIEAAGGNLTDIWEKFDPGDYDGLLIPGGTDVDPERYGRRNECSDSPDPELDAHQFAAIDAFVKAGKPVLGICRGHQVLNVFFGGTLIQDIPTRYTPPGDLPKLFHSQVDDRDSMHLTHAAPGGFPARIYGEEFPVNSAHHQAVETLGEEMEAVQWAADGIVEATRHRSLPVISVQWHPERMCLKHARPDTVDGLPLFRYFLELCRGRA